MKQVMWFILKNKDNEPKFKYSRNGDRYFCREKWSYHSHPRFSEANWYCKQWLGISKRTVRTASVSQVTFKNGVNIVSQLNRIVFSEVISTKEVQDTEVSAIALKYIQKLSQAK